ncbi:hypothetical protein M514_13315 [Trichuris suis]|uniref:Uncharacterized protein n=1 Tax=Trichuris suis TaxID=68888 RepID=A0A085LLF7_9BILA|nr:hypothetical protein M513_13315 [Trichuris suis]KFD59856.1 hypothetical protein M514_13315 [Trichuris suis]
MDTSITITKADKGNAMVVMDRSTYNSKTEELLSSPTYVRIPDDPTEPTRNPCNTSQPVTVSNLATSESLPSPNA